MSKPVNIYYLTKSDKAYMYEVQNRREVCIYTYIHTILIHIVVMMMMMMIIITIIIIINKKTVEDN